MSQVKASTAQYNGKLTDGGHSSAPSLAQLKDIAVAVATTHTGVLLDLQHEQQSVALYGQAACLQG